MCNYSPVEFPAVLRRALSHPNAPVVVGAALGIATTAAYLIGSGRSFGYDAAATFGNFVATPNLIDAFAVHSAMPSMPLKSIASNDHVFLSLISHVIYSLTGSRSEVAYRLVPALAAGGSGCSPARVRGCSSRPIRCSWRTAATCAATAWPHSWRFCRRW